MSPSAFSSVSFSYCVSISSMMLCNLSTVLGRCSYCSCWPTKVCCAGSFVWDCCSCRFGHLTRSLRHEVLEHPSSLPLPPLRQAAPEVDADQPCWRTGFGDGILLSILPSWVLLPKSFKLHTHWSLGCLQSNEEQGFLELQIGRSALSKLALAGMHVLCDPLHPCCWLAATGWQHTSCQPRSAQICSRGWLYARWLRSAGPAELAAAAATSGWPPSTSTISTG